jgi:hypothetical protein
MTRPLESLIRSSGGIFGLWDVVGRIRFDKTDCGVQTSRIEVEADNCGAEMRWTVTGGRCNFLIGTQDSNFTRMDSFYSSLACAVNGSAARLVFPFNFHQGCFSVGS